MMWPVRRRMATLVTIRIGPIARITICARESASIICHALPIWSSIHRRTFVTGRRMLRAATPPRRRLPKQREEGFLNKTKLCLGCIGLRKLLIHTYIHYWMMINNPRQLPCPPPLNLSAKLPRQPPYPVPQLTRQILKTLLKFSWIFCTKYKI